MMARHILKLRWPEIRRDASKYWGKLSDSDLDYINGHLNRFVSVVRSRYGYLQVQAEDEVEAFLYGYDDVPLGLTPV